MKLSRKSDYAARALLCLARAHHKGATMRIEDMAREQNIPKGYLTQILLDLKSQQLVHSLRGQDGGYQLARPPAEISLADVLKAVQGVVFDSPAMGDPQCPAELRLGWGRLKESVVNAALSVTFQQMLDEAAGREKMYYI